MKSLAELGGIERATRAAELSCLIRHLARARGQLGEAAALAAAARAPSRVTETLQKAAVGASGLGLDGGYKLLIGAFQDVLRHTSIFYRWVNDNAVIRLPFDTRIGAVVTAAGASVVEAGAAIPTRRMDLSAATLQRRKAAALVALSEELLDSAGPAVEGLLSRSLRASVSEAVDAEVVAIALAGITPDNATASALDDLGTLLTAVAPTEESRLYALASPDVAIRASTLEAAATGNRLFPDAGPTGGALLPGVPLAVSSALSAGDLILIDAARFAGAADTVEIATSRQTAIQMADDPDMNLGAGSPDTPTAAQAVSMWQTNSIAVRAVAFFGFERVRTGGVAQLTGISW